MKLKKLLAGVALSLFAAPGFAADAPVAMIVAQGGLGDGSWNDTANAGFAAGIKETGLEGRAIESNDVVAQGEEIMRRAADAGFGLVLSLEYAHGEPMQALAPDYPKTSWAIFNQVREGDNIASVLFGEHQGSYLAGILAAKMTTTEGIEGINPEPILGVIPAVRSPGSTSSWLVSFKARNRLIRISRSRSATRKPSAIRPRANRWPMRCSRAAQTSSIILQAEPVWV